MLWKNNFSFQTASSLALVHEWLITWGGSEEVFWQLLSFQPQEAGCLFREDNAQLRRFASYPLKTTFFQRFRWMRRHHPFCLFLMPLAFRKLQLRSSLLLTNCHAFAKCTPKKEQHICYCYTPIRYLWILPKTYLSALPPPARPIARLLMRLLRRVDRKAAAEVDTFVAISKTVQRRIQRVYRRSSLLIYPPVDTDFFTPDRSVPRGDFYLAVARLTPYKKIDLALQACQELGRKLVIVGEGSELKKLTRMASGKIQFLPFQKKAKLRELYQTARGLIFPAQEDFGIVPLEALACDTPVIALARGGATETVAHEREGFLFREPSVSSLREGILSFEKINFSAGQLRQKAMRFSRQRFIDEWRALLMRVSGTRRG